MSGKGDGAENIDYTDRDLGSFLISRGIVNPFQLHGLVKEYRQQKGTPHERTLEDLLVERGLVKADFLENLRIQTKAWARCTRCSKIFQIHYFNPGTPYACKACGAKLEQTEQTEATIVMGVEEPPSPAPDPRAAGEDPDETTDYTDRDLGALLVSRAIVTPHQLMGVVKEYRERKGTPNERPLEKLLVDHGLVKSDFLDNLRVQTRAWARCERCSKRFKISYFNPATPYVCKACGGKLEQTQVTEATIVVGEPTALEKTTVQGQTTTRNATQTGTHSGTRGTTHSGTRGGTKADSKRVPPEVEAAQNDPKKVFGKYIVTKELGRGGTAVVYKAWDTMIHQFVALKIIKLHDPDESETSEPSNEIRDFQREARMSARLRHPNIIRIYELGSIDEKHYLAMELMEGPTFFELIHGSKQRNNKTTFHENPEKFLKLMRDVSRAVHYAHSLNPPVVHRDLKPQNVLMDMNHTPYVADFGLAKEVEMGNTVTVTGVVKGTPSYMAPEQAEGHSKDTDARTDVYSLGAIIYEILTGRPPFVGDNVRQVLNQIVTRIPDRPNEVIAKLATDNPKEADKFKPVARELETICLKCLEKKKSDRYQTAQTLADDVDRFLQNLEIEAREPGIIRKAIRKAKAHPMISAVAGAILLAASVAGGVVAFRPEVVGAEQIVATAAQQLEARDWAGLRGSITNLTQLDPGNSSLGKFERALKEHDADMNRRRAEWEVGLKRLKAEPVKGVLEGLRPTYRGGEEIKTELYDKLRFALIDLQGATDKESRELWGTGPNPGWLDEKVKQSARAARDRAANLLELAQDADFPFEADRSLGLWRNNLDRLLAYQGTWQLRVNVAPYGEVVLILNGKEVSREFTPLGIRGLEVGPGYQLEVSWPSRKEPKQKATKHLNGLRHGAVVVVSGDMSKGDLQIAQ